ncbi:hypothetical protein PENNAL_c0630G04833, partial [Penicillium nalgiovense]
AVDRAEQGEEAPALPVPGFVVAVPQPAPRREGLWSFAMLNPSVRWRQSKALKRGESVTPPAKQ